MKYAILADVHLASHAVFGGPTLAGVNTRASLIAELGDSVFKLPGTDAYQTASEYLSGDVVSKLAEAETVRGFWKFSSTTVTPGWKGPPVGLGSSSP